MSSIGPQLPPHLTKRKRTPDNDTNAPLPPAKKNQHDKDSDSNPGIGLSAPPSIGPAAPPESIKSSSPARVSEPTLPPSAADLDAISGNDSQPPVPALSRRVLGPSLPVSDYRQEKEPQNQQLCRSPRIPGPNLPSSSQRAQHKPDSDSDSNSDSDYGPSLPASSTHAHFAAQQTYLPSDFDSGALKRDDWMLAPPSATDSSSRRDVDPARIRARKFASGPRANTTVPTGEISTLWTETATEKAQRVANSVLGRGLDPSKGAQASSGAGQSHGVMLGVGGKQLTEEESERIRSSIAASRGPSLIESYRKANASKIAEDEDKDDPSKRAFDREKDMAIGGRGLGGQDKREMLRQAKDFGGRFSKGSFL